MQVRVASSHLLSSLVLSTVAPPPAAGVAPVADPAGVFKGDQRLARLHAKFVKLSETKLPKTAGERETKGAAASAGSAGSAAASSEYATALCRRHAGVLGLSSLVTSHPYDVPAYLPRTLSRLSRFHLGDPRPIGEGVKHVLADFMRTHKDNWREFKQRFTAAELDDLAAATFAPTYFA